MINWTKFYRSVAIINGLCFLVCVLLLLGKEKYNPGTTTVETFEEVNISSVDSAWNTPFNRSVPEEVSVLLKPQGIEVISGPVPEVKLPLVKPAKLYRDTLRTKDAEITLEIVSEGEIYQTKVESRVNHKETVRTVTNTVTKNVGGFYFSPGMDINLLGGLRKIETGITYMRPNLGLTVAPYLDLAHITKEMPLGVSLNVHIKF